MLTVHLQLPDQQQNQETVVEVSKHPNIEALLNSVSQVFKAQGGVSIDVESKEYALKDREQNILLSKLEDIGSTYCLI
jgi:hypothetical protein